MIREVDLVSYLPPFVAEYKETNLTLTAENPEFVLVWKAADRALKNEFISTADEYGISRFEKILHILPSRDDTLESRRSRVQSRWFTSLPYTWRMLIQKLIALCGEDDFTITKQFDFYRIDLDVHLELFGQVEELERIIETMLPCNMVMDARNSIPMKAEGVALTIGGVCFVNSYLITNDWQEKKTIEGNILIGSGVSESDKWMITNDEKRKDTISGSADFGGGLSYAAAYFITNDSRENVVVRGSAVHGAAAVNTVSVVITEDFNEQFDISGNGSVASGVVTAEHIEIN